jgi:hypothetical protein
VRSIDADTGNVLDAVFSWQSDVVHPSGAQIRFDHILMGGDD